jgi:hypothetical protein
MGEMRDSHLLLSDVKARHEKMVGLVDTMLKLRAMSWTQSRRLVLVGVMFVAGCIWGPIAVNDGLPACIPDWGTHELRGGLQSISLLGCTSPENGSELTFYPALGYRTGLGVGPVAFELGAMELSYTEEKTLGFFGGSHTIDQYAIGPEIALGWRNPAITLRGMLGGFGLRVYTDGVPDITPYFRYWPQATLLFGSSRLRSDLGYSVGVRASENAVGPVLLAQMGRDGIGARPEGSVMFRAPWSNRDDLESNLTLSLGVTVTASLPLHQH